MPAAIQNFTIEQGTTFTTGITYPTDISLNTFACQVKAKASGEPVATATCTIVGLYDIHIELTDEQTWLIPAYGKTYKELTEYTYDVTMSTPDGITSRLLNGIISVSPGVTKP
jgi:hypothetical protein